MRLSEIGNKEIVEISKGCLYGKLWDAELIFDQHTGLIQSLLIPQFPGGTFTGDLRLSFKSIITIGEDAIIFKLP